MGKIHFFLIHEALNGGLIACSLLILGEDDSIGESSKSKVESRNVPRREMAEITICEKSERATDSIGEEKTLLEKANQPSTN